MRTTRCDRDPLRHAGLHPVPPHHSPVGAEFECRRPQPESRDGELAVRADGDVDRSFDWQWYRSPVRPAGRQHQQPTVHPVGHPEGAIGGHVEARRSERLLVTHATDPADLTRVIAVPQLGYDAVAGTERAEVETTRPRHLGQPRRCHDVERRGGTALRERHAPATADRELQPVRKTVFCDRCAGHHEPEAPAVGHALDVRPAGGSTGQQVGDRGVDRARLQRTCRAGKSRDQLDIGARVREHAGHV